MNSTPFTLASFVVFTLSTAPALCAQDFHSGFYTPINNQVWNGPGNTTVTANGNISFSFAGMTTDGSVTDQGAFESFEATIPVRAAVTLDLKAQTSGTFTGGVSTPLFPLPSFQIGPSVLVQPYFYTQVDVTGTIEAGVRSSFVLPISTKIGISIPGNPAFFGLISAPVCAPRVTPPDVVAGIDVHVSCTMGVCFLIAIEGVPIGGPSIAINIGENFAVDPLGDPWWSAGGHLRIEGSWGFGGADGLLEEFPASALLLYRRRIHVDSAEGSLPGVHPPLRWSKIYDRGDNEDATCMLQNGSEYVVFGNGQGVGNRTMSMSLDGGGVPNWQYISDALAFASMRPRAVCKTTNGDYLVAGWTGTSAGMRVERYTPTGTPLWAKAMGGPPSTLVYWNCILPTTNDGAILGGQVTYVATQITHPVFAEIDGNGSVLWSTEIENGADTYNPEINAMSWTPSGDILVVGAIDYTNSPDFVAATLLGRNALVLRLHADGTVVSSRTLGARGWEIARCIAVSEDGSYAFGGNVPVVGVDSEAHSAWIAKFNADDTLQWSAVYAGESINGSAGDTPYDSVGGLVSLKKGGFLATANTGLATTLDSQVFQIDDAGMPVWFKSYRGIRLDWLNCIIPTQHGFMAAGFTDTLNDTIPFAQHDMWILRAGFDGWLDFTPESGFVAWNDQAKWVRTNWTAMADLPVSNIRTTVTPVDQPLAVSVLNAIIELMTY